MFIGSQSSTSKSRITYKTASIHLLTQKEEWYINIPVEALTKYKIIAVIATKGSLVITLDAKKLIIMGYSLTKACS